ETRQIVRHLRASVGVDESQGAKTAVGVDVQRARQIGGGTFAVGTLRRRTAEGMFVWRVHRYLDQGGRCVWDWERCPRQRRPWSANGFHLLLQFGEPRLERLDAAKLFVHQRLQRRLFGGGRLLCRRSDRRQRREEHKRKSGDLPHVPAAGAG